MSKRNIPQRIKDKFSALFPRAVEHFRRLKSSNQSSRVSSPHPLLDPTILATNEDTPTISSAPNILDAQSPDISHGPGLAPPEQPSRQPSPISATNEPNTSNPPVPQFTEWNIDASSISQLREWGAARQGSKWTQLLDKIDGALKSKTLDTLVAFVPNSPLPAKTLVQALLNLVQLGINIPLIQKKVYDFAQEAIEYIGCLVTAIGEDRGSLKNDLEKICGVVNDVCRWASEQVSKVSLSEGELDEWKGRLTREKEKFLATSITRVLVNQAASERQSFIEKKLATHVSSHYQHTDQRRNTCAPGTRMKILEDINRWLSQPSGNERIYWLTGIPGSGKSTVSATVAEKLRESGAPITAQYFVSRNYDETTDPHRLIPTIAQQLAEKFPAAARIIHDGLKNGFPSAQDEQVKSLVLRPLNEVSKSHDVVVVIIDALDELRSDADTMVSLLADIGSKLPENVRFIITSRPESWSDITNAEHAVFKQLNLGTTDSGDDIRRFISSSLEDIKRGKLGWENWPSEKQLNGLVDNASGLFHYAATAVAWIKSQIKIHGTAGRETIFEKVSSRGVDGLHQLYRVILKEWKEMDTDPEEQHVRLERFRDIVGCIVVLRTPLSVGDIVALLAGSFPAEFDVENFLQQMRSILVPRTASSFTDAIPQMHKSFYDFITSGPSGADFQVVARNAHLAATRGCLRVIINAVEGPNTGNRYAVANWHRHLRETIDGGIYDDDEMWRLLTHMGTDARIARHAVEIVLNDAFLNMAYVGWVILKRNMPDISESKLEPVTNILTLIKEERRRKREELELERERRFFREFRREDFERDGVPYTKIYEQGLFEAWRELHPEPDAHATTSGISLA